jgi:hypothetical protein
MTEWGVDNQMNEEVVVEGSNLQDRIGLYITATAFGSMGFVGLDQEPARSTRVEGLNLIEVCLA